MQSHFKSWKAAGSRPSKSSIYVPFRRFATSFESPKHVLRGCREYCRLNYGCTATAMEGASYGPMSGVPT